MRQPPALLTLAFLALVLFALALWAVRDAQRRRKSALFVVIAVVCFFPFGLIAWLLFRPPVATLARRPDSPYGRVR